MQGDNQLMFTTTTMNLNHEPQPPPQQQQHEHLKCPRCESNNTKFCYYNNYNLSQPRHFCKNCRRYWTKGGTLRNIPIGGSTRKKNTKRSLHNSNKNTSIETLSSNIPHVVNVQKHESSVIQGYGNDQMGLTPGGQFAKLLMDGLNPNFVGGMNENGLLRNTSNVGEFDSGFLGMGHQSNDQSHVSEGGHNGWPDLSIYTPGSSFH